MVPTISYYNGVLYLHRHESMEEQLDRTSSKDFPSSNVDIGLVLEKAKGDDCWTCYRGCLCDTL
jgi:hypothetical protein